MYQFSAIAASAGIGALAIAATYYRMHWHHLADESLPWADLGATLLLAFGGMVRSVACGWRPVRAQRPLRKRRLEAGQAAWV